MATMSKIVILLLFFAGHCAGAPGSASTGRSTYPIADPSYDIQPVLEPVTFCDRIGGRCLKTSTCPSSMTSLGSIFCPGGDACCKGEIPCGSVPSDSPTCTNPWQISLRRSLDGKRIDVSDMSKSVHVCAGVLVDESWVLTTATCALRSFQVFPDYSAGALVAGEYNVTAIEGREQFRTATEIFLHPSFNTPGAKQPMQTNPDLKGENDYAMIKVNKAFTVFGGDDCSSVICLSDDNFDTVDCDTPVQLHGWENDYAMIKVNKAFTVFGGDDCSSVICLSDDNFDTVDCDTPVQLHGWGPEPNSYENAPVGKQFKGKLWNKDTCKNLKMAMYFDSSAVHTSNLCYTSDPLSNDSKMPCLSDEGGAVAYKKEDGFFTLYALLQAPFQCKKTLLHTVGDTMRIRNWIGNKIHHGTEFIEDIGTQAMTVEFGGTGTEALTYFSTMPTKTIL